MNIDKFLKQVSNQKIANSFSQSVYLIDKDKILKIYNNLDKGQNELDYLKYFSGKLNVPKVLDSGLYNNRFYIVMNYIKGDNYTDEEQFHLDNETYKQIGVLLGKMHSLKPLKEDKWKEYMLYRIDRNYNLLKEKQVDIDVEKVYEYLKEQVNSLEYDPKCIHTDFRIGNLIFNEKVNLIDLESTKSGDPVFDFVKLYRIFDTQKFNLFKEGYESVRKLDPKFDEKLHFYNLYDAFTTTGWCIEVNRYNSDFYKFNMKFLKEEIENIWHTEHTHQGKNVAPSLSKK